jgi:hypothetical protein
MDHKRLALISIIIIVLGVGGFLYFRGDSNPPKDIVLTAAIIDGLSEEFPNPPFIEETRESLEDGGYQVDYYNSSQVTVELYETLPTLGYDIVILRIHSAPMDLGKKPGAALFTSESEPGLHFTKQLLGWVRMARTLTSGDRYYAVTPSFFLEGMKGEFNDTGIITMSCYGAVDNYLASIFIEKGASSFIGWSEKVSAGHMDEATSVLLSKLFDDGLDLKEAVAYTRENVGEDPTYGSELILYQDGEIN